MVRGGNSKIFQFFKCQTAVSTTIFQFHIKVYYVEYHLSTIDTSFWFNSLFSIPEVPSTQYSNTHAQCETFFDSSTGCTGSFYHYLY